MLEKVRDYSFELLVSVISFAELILKGSEWNATEFLSLLVYLHWEIYKLMTRISEMAAGMLPSRVQTLTTGYIVVFNWTERERTIQTGSIK